MPLGAALGAVPEPGVGPEAGDGVGAKAHTDTADGEAPEHYGIVP